MHGTPRERTKDDTVSPKLCSHCGGPLFLPSAAPDTARLYCSRACQAKAAYERQPDRSVAKPATLVFLDIDKYWAAVRRGPPK
jgi:ferredoxin